jgi:hypothetical protein
MALPLTSAVMRTLDGARCRAVPVAEAIDQIDNGTGTYFDADN